MPAFDWKMDDRQIAELLDYVRNSWGNSGAPVAVDEVGRLRNYLEATEKITVPH